MRKTKKCLAALMAAVMTAASSAVMPVMADGENRDNVYDSSLILSDDTISTDKAINAFLWDSETNTRNINAYTALNSDHKTIEVHSVEPAVIEAVKEYVKANAINEELIMYVIDEEEEQLTGTYFDELPSSDSTQEAALRFMLTNYINDNNIDAWIYDKESTPNGIIFIGYYRKNENIPLDIINQVEKKGFDPQLVNFVKEDHEKDGLIEDIDVIKRLINWYISENKLNAGIVPEFELLDGLGSNALYVEYTAEKTDIPEKLAAYIKDRKIDPDLVKTGVSGSFSKQNESVVGISFEEFSKLTEDEVKAMFEEKGLTDSMYYRLWTEENINDEVGHEAIWVILKPNPFPVSNPEIADSYKVCWEDDRFASALGLPKELFEFKQNTPVRIGIGDNNGKYCSCNINAKAANSSDTEKLLAAALNYVQLSPYFVSLHYDYLGCRVAPAVQVKGDVNGDGKFTIADVVTFKKWLYGISDTPLANWEAADFCEDGVLDSFDFCIMRRKIIEKYGITADESEKTGAVSSAKPAVPNAVHTNLSVSYDEAKERFGYPIEECTRSDFLGYKVGIVSQNEKTDSKEAFCLDLTYEFENGLVYIADQDRSAGKIADNGVKQYEYKGRIFVEEQDSGTDGKIYIGYYPTDMGGLGYRAIFDKDTDINEIMDTIISLEL
ncbi:dockerin type I repeat-containing protein [Ruminococcus flavefaciens]|uniref:dockerin type I repeat-containing protein n=1 Tax=Ruminococcus flavefaciens TaxID=1265 RepID=UPI0012D2C602|nr:dockerin type I repeat-containing protein [Ruminococcus flavefaciens]